MLTYYEELSWPKVPQEFCITDETFMIEQFQPAHPYPDYPYYRQFKCYNNTLYEKLQPLFDFNIRDRIFYQIVKHGISTHKDTGRKIIYNYLLDTGGDNVYTNFYDENKTTEVFSVKIPSQTWHRLDVSYYHNVINIQKPRIAISIYEKF